MDKLQSVSVLTSNPLKSEDLHPIDAWWRACNYLSVGVIHLKDNLLPRESLKSEHVKHRLLGRWGTSPALSFIWAHLNRIIKRGDCDVIFVAAPGHGAPGVLGPTYLEGAYSEIYPDKSEDGEGMRKFFKQFSFPGHTGSHVTPKTPGSIHEGGELGYSLSRAYGVAFDKPELIVACAVGDGDAETGPLATAWHSNKFINPIRDGAVLPILNLNGYKIANPTILARISHAELEALLVGYGYKPYFVEGSAPSEVHQKVAASLDAVVAEIRAIQRQAREGGKAERPRWPMIVLRAPKGWTGPKEIAGHKIEGSWRAHQVPFSDVRGNPANLQLLDGKAVVVSNDYSRINASLPGDNCASAMKGVVADPSRYDWAGDVPLKRPCAQTVIYETRVDRRSSYACLIKGNSAGCDNARNKKMRRRCRSRQPRDIARRSGASILVSPEGRV